MKIIMILTIILFVSCSTSKDIKNIDDTEHNWRGDNGIEFKE
jgi:hypothetical protein|tara:strand:- start:337 stop:462 length:126 start_codon:yes stop_codon:yes gene_type:complete